MTWADINRIYKYQLRPRSGWQSGQQKWPHNTSSTFQLREKHSRMWKQQLKVHKFHTKKKKKNNIECIWRGWESIEESYKKIPGILL